MARKSCPRARRGRVDRRPWDVRAGPAAGYRRPCGISRAHFSPGADRMRISPLVLLPAALLTAAPAVAHGQPPAQGRPRGPMAPVRSPEVQKDGRVTFRFRAPNAQRVTV